MIYIPIRSDKAAQLSAAIYQLTRPPAVRNPADVSSFYCGWVQHPTRPEVACMVVPETESIPVHTAADGALLQQTLAAFVPDEITDQEAQALASAIVANAGKTIPVAAFVPPSWQPYVMDYQTAVNDGWIPTPKGL